MALLLTWLSESFRHPRKTIARLLAFGWDAELRWLFFAAMTALNLTLAAFQQTLLAGRFPNLPLPDNLLLATAEAAMLQVLVVFVQQILSQIFGGRARLTDLALLAGWLQAVFLLPSIGVVAIILLAPGFMELAMLTLAVATIVLLVAGLAEVNRFAHWSRALAVALLSTMAVLPVARFLNISPI